MTSEERAMVDKFKSDATDGSVAQREIVTLYERDILPLQMAEMRASAERSMRFDTLYLTAGTQPYSQTLSILATPADRVVFIATDDKTCRESVARAVEMAGLPSDAYEVREFQEPFDAADMAREMYCHVVTQGGRAAMDITSGRKVMSAALSSLAAQLEIPQYYLSGIYLRGGFAVDVERLAVPNVTAIVRHMRELDAEADGRDNDMEGKDV